MFALADVNHLETFKETFKGWDVQRFARFSGPRSTEGLSAYLVQVDLCVGQACVRPVSFLRASHRLGAPPSVAPLAQGPYLSRKWDIKIAILDNLAKLGKSVRLLLCLSVLTLGVVQGCTRLRWAETLLTVCTMLLLSQVFFVCNPGPRNQNPEGNIESQTMSKKILNGPTSVTWHSRISKSSQNGLETPHKNRQSPCVRCDKRAMSSYRL